MPVLKNDHPVVWPETRNVVERVNGRECRIVPDDRQRSLGREKVNLSGRVPLAKRSDNGARAHDVANACKPHNKDAARLSAECSAMSDAIHPESAQHRRAVVREVQEIEGLLGDT